MNASVLCEVSCKKGNEGSKVYYDEERQTGYSGYLPYLWDQDVPYWKDIAASPTAYPSRCENNLSMPEDKYNLYPGAGISFVKKSER